MKRVGIFAAVVALLSSTVIFGLAAPGQRTGAQGGALGHWRVERVYLYPDRWESECDFDACGIGILFRLPVRTPRSAERVDAVMTMTFDYRTSPQDYGVASAGAFASGEGGACW